MNANVGRLLREGMERFTGDVRVPPGLVRRVVRRHRRRRVAGIAVVACVAAGGTAGGLAAAGLNVHPGGGTAGGPRPLHGYTVAYVLRHSAQAASQQHLVEYSRSVDLMAAARATNLYQLSWDYGIESASSTGANRREVIDDGRLQAQYASTWGHGRITTTAIEYQTRTWDKDTAPYAYTTAPTGCAPANPSDYYAFLHWGLRCVHDLKITGRATVDGLQTIKIVSVAQGVDPLTMEFWVNPRTYLPVRTLLDSHNSSPAAERVDEQTDYQWLAPTTANLATLAVRIPAGFKRDPYQPLFDLCGFIPCN